jgi:DNA mismatch repair protein MutS2
LRRAEAAEASPRAQPPALAEAASEQGGEISLLGLRAQQAIEELERFLDRAIRSGGGRVRIIHGVGSGALKRAVGDYLARCPYRLRVRPGEPQEGGAGVTIVEW